MPDRKSEINFSVTVHRTGRSIRFAVVHQFSSRHLDCYIGWSTLLIVQYCYVHTRVKHGKRTILKNCIVYNCWVKQWWINHRNILVAYYSYLLTSLGRAWGFHGEYCNQTWPKDDLKADNLLCIQAFHLIKFISVDVANHLCFSRRWSFGPNCASISAISSCYCELHLTGLMLPFIEPRMYSLSAHCLAPPG